MAGRKSDFTLPTNTLDELFSTQEERDDAKLSKIRDIPLELIDDFPDHPFKVRDDEDMIQLVESVKERGVITPATVRQKEDGRYPTPTTTDVFYTNAEGSLVMPEELSFGKGYSIVEVQAPYGYVLDETPVYFDVTEDNSTEESGVTVVKVDKPNMAQK